MNYIKRLEGEKKDAQEAREKALEALQELEVYLDSAKFRCGDDLDGYVNVSDVVLRLREIRSSLAG